jgi:proteasome lid subunit RPN8/RPN11
MNNNIQVTITPEFKSIVEYFNSENKNREWSGILVFKFEEDEKTNKITNIIPIDIFFMDIGTSTYTEFEYTADAFEWLDDKGYLLDENISTGLVHSHHTMDTYFSGTDLDELRSNVKHHNIYFSLIVNNAHKYTGKIASIAEVTYKSFKDDSKKITTTKIIEQDCKFIFQNNVPQEYINRYTKIEKEYEASKKIKTYMGIHSGIRQQLKTVENSKETIDFNLDGVEEYIFDGLGGDELFDSEVEILTEELLTHIIRKFADTKVAGVRKKKFYLEEAPTMNKFWHLLDNEVPKYWNKFKLLFISEVKLAYNSNNEFKTDMIDILEDLSGIVEINIDTDIDGERHEDFLETLEELKQYCKNG